MMSKFFIRRPIVAIVIAIITVIVGLVSMLTVAVAGPTTVAPLSSSRDVGLIGC